MTTLGGGIHQTGVSAPAAGGGDNEIARFDGSGSQLQGSAGATLSDSLGLVLDNAGAYVAVGANPAQSGVVRIPNDTCIAGRNTANNADRDLLCIDTASRAVLGNTLSNTRIQATSTCDFLFSGGNTPLSVGTTTTTLKSGATTRFEVDGTGIGFFAAAPVAKPTITGAKGGNAALASLLTGLAALGLVTDSTT